MVKFRKPAPAPPTRILWQRREPLRKSEARSAHIHPDPVQQRRVKAMRSFSDLLEPRLDLGDGIIGLRDLHSTGALFSAKPIASEAKNEEQLELAHRKICAALIDVFPERKINPWIVQVFVYDEPSLAMAFAEIKSYACGNGHNDEYTRAWLATLSQHFADVSAEQGLFQNAPTSWRGRVRRIRICVWRKKLPGETQDPEDNLEQICERLQQTCAQADIQLTRENAAVLHSWLVQLFAPHPQHDSTHYHSSTALAARTRLRRHQPVGTARVSTIDHRWRVVVVSRPTLEVHPAGRTQDCAADWTPDRRTVIRRDQAGTLGPDASRNDMVDDDNILRTGPRGRQNQASAP